MNNGGASIKLRSFLARKAYNIRVSSLRMTTAAGSGHATTCLSAADIAAVLFFHTMRYNPRDYEDLDSDRFILSKGHASPLLYAAWKEVGLLTDEDLQTYRAIDSNLEGHPTARFPYVEAATGSLGMGLSVGVGEALNARLDDSDYRTFVLLGDSELAEGSVWEAVQLAVHYKLDNLIAIVDANRLGQSTEVLYGHDVDRYGQIFEAFGWRTLTVDGHDIEQLVDAFDQAETPDGRPIVVIAKTFKGFGVDAVEDKEGFHGKPFKPEELEKVLSGMAKRFADVAESEPVYDWQPRIPQQRSHTMVCNVASVSMTNPAYEKGQMVATRKAYGQALAALGGVCDTVVSLDAEVKNSTFAELFEKEHPKRFFQCFIAEQNMVSMGVGLARRGKVPFISTFGAFFSRAHDQIRMAAVGQSPLRLAGSHVGVSIGQDGPSQMALEDIALMRALPKSVVLYPSDAVSTHKLMEQMVRYEDGISYLRTTRAATPVIYAYDEEFSLGGCKVVRESERDQVCVVGAGITLHEAIKAHDMLRTGDKPCSVCVIDLYSVKPLDAETIRQKARTCGGRLLVVEDHYPEGGMGEAVMHALATENFTIEHLAVNKLPRSGKPDELLAYVGIDAASIAQQVRAMIG